MPVEPQSDVTRHGMASSRHLKVLHIAPTPFFADRGCHIRIRNELQSLRRHPLRAMVCTYHLGRDVDGIDVRRIPAVPGYHKLDAGFSPFRFPSDILLFFLVLKTCLRERPHILHGHLHEGALIGWAARTCLFRRRMALVMDMQGSLSGELVGYGTLRARSLLTRLVVLAEGLICRMPDFILCSSQESRSTLVTRFRVPREKTMLLQDVVPESFFAPADREGLRRQLGLPADRKIILYTGSLLPGKGVQALLDAMEILCARREDLFFVLVGYPVEGVAPFLETRHLSDRVRLTGRVAYDELAAWLGTGDVAIEPKAEESGEASGKLLHYMAAGLPVACFATANNRKFLGELGYYGEEVSAEALARAVEHALADPGQARRRGEQGRTVIGRDYSMAGAGRKLLALYRRLSSRGRGHPPL